MERQIKFRAWDVVMKSMHELAGFQTYKELTVIHYGTSGFKNCSPDHVKLMQFTGLLDKNRKEIYEGDV
jgi:uncharacterized phage protein (TIGR01671 family)